MIHTMHLYEEPFELIKSGIKTIEIRLYDEKRRKIDLNDMIIFQKLPDNGEVIKCTVVGLSRFGTFTELLSAFDKANLGHPGNITPEEQLNRQYKIYSKEEERINGVLGIHLRLEDGSYDNAQKA